jgi:hypothetical protein
MIYKYLVAVSVLESGREYRVGSQNGQMGGFWQCSVLQNSALRFASIVP